MPPKFDGKWGMECLNTLSPSAYPQREASVVEECKQNFDLINATDKKLVEPYWPTDDITFQIERNQRLVAK